MVFFFNNSLILHYYYFNNSLGAKIKKLKWTHDTKLAPN